MLVDDVLHGTTENGLVAADFKTGEIKWRDDSVGLGSILFAEGRLYVHAEDGDVMLIEVSSDGYRVRGRFTPPDRPKHPGDMAWAYPVLAGGVLYIREHTSLWAYDVRRRTP